jgi:hypothetical protein
MKTLIKIWLISMMAFFASCEDNYIAPQESEIVVEGWIEEGGFPVVMLTKSVAIQKEYQNLSDLDDNLIRWAKVTIYDGNDSIILTGKYDDAYMPPYIYTTSKMSGQAGHTYTLKVEYRDYLATASTTILPAPVIEHVTVERSDESDTLYQVKIQFYEDPLQKNYYQVFSRVGGNNKQYLASFMGTLDDQILDTHPIVPVYRGRQLGSGTYLSNFTKSDSVAIKLSQIDANSYNFWDDYTKNLSLSGFLMLPPYSNIRSNITGGTGYWCGMGSSVRYVIISDEISTP